MEKVVSRPRSVFDVKADLTPILVEFGGLERFHQLTNGIEDDFELGVVFLLERFEFKGKILVRREQLSQSDESAHDFDVDLDGTGTAQDARKHGDTLFGEGVCPIPVSATTFL